MKTISLYCYFHVSIYSTKAPMLSLVHRPSLLSHTEEGRVLSGWVSSLFVSLIPPLSPGKSFTIWPLEICVLYVVVICNEKMCDGDVLPLSTILGHCQSAYPLENIFKWASQATHFKMHQHVDMTKAVEIKMIKRQDHWMQDLSPGWSLYGTLSGHFRVRW